MPRTNCSACFSPLRMAHATAGQNRRDYLNKRRQGTAVVRTGTKNHERNAKGLGNKMRQQHCRKSKRNPTMVHTSAATKPGVQFEREAERLHGSTARSDVGECPATHPGEQQPPGKLLRAPEPPAIPPTKPTVGQKLRRALDSAGFRRQSGEAIDFIGDERLGIFSPLGAAEVIFSYSCGRRGRGSASALSLAAAPLDGGRF